MEKKPVSPMRIKEPLAAAWQQMKTQVFPFKVPLWIAVGLAVWLASFSGQNQPALVAVVPQFLFFPGLGPAKTSIESGQLARNLDTWLSGATSALPATAGTIGVLAIGAVLLFTWLTARGQLMLAWSALHNNYSPSAAWNGAKPATGSVFKFRLVAELLRLAMVIGGVASVGACVYNLIQQRATQTGAYLLVVVPMALGWTLLLLVPTILLRLLDAFAIPLMLRDNLRAAQAMSHVWTLVKKYPRAVIVYLLLRAVFLEVAGVAMLIAGFVTCGIGLTPVIGQAIFTPYFVFDRLWPMRMLESVGPDWNPFPTPSLPASGESDSANAE